MSKERPHLAALSAASWDALSMAAEAEKIGIDDAANRACQLYASLISGRAGQRLQWVGGDGSIHEIHFH